MDFKRSTHFSACLHYKWAYEGYILKVKYADPMRYRGGNKTNDQGSHPENNNRGPTLQLFPNFSVTHSSTI